MHLHYDGVYVEWQQLSIMIEQLEQYLSNPDRIVRDLFRNPDDAIAFFRTYLPNDLIQILDLEYLPGSYMDPNFREHQSDLLFQIPTKEGNTTKIALLFEHKIKPDRKVFFQIFRYLSRIYEGQKESIPVVPYLFYHHEGSFTDGNFLSLFSLTEKEKRVFTRYIPDFHMETFHLAQSDPERVRFSLHLYAFLRTIKYVDLNEIEKHWSDIVTIAASVFRGEKGVVELMKLVVYVLNRTDADEDVVKEPVMKLSPDLEDVMITTAERLRQEGRREGMLSGKLEGKLEDARNMLKEAIPLETVLRITGLSVNDLRMAGIVSDGDEQDKE